MVEARERPRTRRRVALGVVLGLTVLLAVVGVPLAWFDDVAHLPSQLNRAFRWGSLLAAGLSLAGAVGGLLLARYPGRHRRLRLATGCLCLALAATASAQGAYLLYHGSAHRCTSGFVPGSLNLCAVAKALLLYGHRHDGRLPDPNAWCDTLLAEGLIAPANLCVPRVALRWPTGRPWPFGLGNWPPPGMPPTGMLPGSVRLIPPPGPGRCDFALNTACRRLQETERPRRPLVFTTFPGWNQAGGRECVDATRFSGQGFLVYCAQDGCFFERPQGVDLLDWGEPH